jgi:hypothetical protein
MKVRRCAYAEYKHSSSPSMRERFLIDASICGSSSSERADGASGAIGTLKEWQNLYVRRTIMVLGMGLAREQVSWWLSHHEITAREPAHRAICVSKLSVTRANRGSPAPKRRLRPERRGCDES